MPFAAITKYMLQCCSIFAATSCWFTYYPPWHCSVFHSTLPHQIWRGFDKKWPSYANCCKYAKLKLNCSKIAAFRANAVNDLVRHRYFLPHFWIPHLETPFKRPICIIQRAPFRICWELLLHSFFQLFPRFSLFYALLAPETPKWPPCGLRYPKGIDSCPSKYN